MTIEGDSIFTIGCDVGSQSVKGLLVTPDGQVAGRASVRHPVRYRNDDWAEQDPADWESGLAQVVHGLLTSVGLRDDDIAAVAFASQVDGVVAVDAADRPLRPAIIWMDRRASEQAAELRDRVGEAAARAITGCNIDASHVGPKIRWIVDAEPDVDRAATGYLLPGSYLVARLTGERVVDHANASSTLLYDVVARAWSPLELGRAPR